MPTQTTIDDLESAVLGQIMAWRAGQARRESLPVSALVVTMALLAGLALGWTQSHRGSELPASESVVVSSDAGLPSLLLANN
ncbi:MAG: hypothetical protein QM718_00070 [Steroidobacteraceae bacterium]